MGLFIFKEFINRISALIAWVKYFKNQLNFFAYGPKHTLKFVLKFDEKSYLNKYNLSTNFVGLTLRKCSIPGSERKRREWLLSILIIGLEFINCCKVFCIFWKIILKTRLRQGRLVPLLGSEILPWSPFDF